MAASEAEEVLAGGAQGEDNVPHFLLSTFRRGAGGRTTVMITDEFQTVEGRGALK